MTDQDIPEVEPDDESTIIEPKQLNGADIAVLALGFAHNICDALVESFARAIVVVGAHANYRSKENEQKEAVTKFLAELDELPTTVK